MNLSNVKKELKKSLTILIPAGIFSTPIQGKIYEMTKKYNLGVYLSTAQNIRLINIDDTDVEIVREELKRVGARLKGPGKFPLPRVCMGGRYCNLGMVDTMALSERIMEHFEEGEPYKPKYKISISGCPASCSNSLITDIGIKATKSGYDLYAGGKGGGKPQIGRRIAKGIDEVKLLEMMKQLVEFHDQKTGKKMRMAKLLNDPEFPFVAV